MSLSLEGNIIEQVESFRYLGSFVTEVMKCTKARIAMAKEAIGRKRQILCSILDMSLRKKLVKCFVWSVATYKAETWTLRK